jgi:sortase (surface protein transpeptidase)
MPASVARRRPAEIMPPPRRHPAVPRRRPLPSPPPVRGRRTVPMGIIVAALLFVGLFTVAAGLGAATGFDVRDLFRGPPEPPPPAYPVLEPSRPTRLTIPSIKVDAPILTVGLAPDGSIGVPPVTRHNAAGWFDQGPTPGQYGPALIVGHVDTRTGPSVFHDLVKMRPGQRINVRRQDGTVAIFQVNSVERFGKSKLPIERVYGDFTRPSLRLITCGGTWLGYGRGYSDNLIVFASLVASKEA